MHTKKPLSILLALALVLGMLPWAAMPARADGCTEIKMEGETLKIGEEKWEVSDGKLELSGGNYRLGSDIATTAPIVVRDTVALDLAGHIIDRGLTEATENGYVIVAGWLGKLTVEDSGPDATHNPEITYTDPITHETVTVNGGVITGGYNSGRGGGVYASDTFNMKGGTICGNTSGDQGGGVYASGNFNMEGGAIGGNTSSKQGGGVFVGNSYTFTMKGGTIRGNTASSASGGGVCVYGALSMSGSASITGNTTAGDGGGVWFDGTTLSMSDSASITGNTAAGDGGGVFIGGGTLNLSDTSSITGNTAAAGKRGGGVFVGTGKTMNLSGAPTITGNKLGSADQNVYLMSNVIISLTGALETGASVGVTKQNSTVGTVVAQKGGERTAALTAAEAACFTSDNANFAVGLNADGKAYLGKPLTGAMVTLAQTSYTYDGSRKEPTVTVADGNTTLTEGTDYTVSYSDNTNAGTATATVTGKGSYAGTASQTFSIGRATPTMSGALSTNATYGDTLGTITSWLNEQQPTGVDGSPLPGTWSWMDSDFTPVGNVGAQSFSATFTPDDSSNYNSLAGSVTVTVNPKSVTPTVTLSATSYAYDGTAKKPTVTVKDGNTPLTSSDYTVSYSNNTDLGTATVTVTLRGNYSGAATATFRIYGVKGDVRNGKLVVTSVNAPNDALLIAAVYDASGRQVGVKTVNVKNIEAFPYDTGLTVSSGCTCKLMLADGTTYAPLCAAWNS